MISALAFFISLSIQGLQAQDYSGRGLYLLGDSAAAMGRAGTGVSSFGTDLFYQNPASVATLERWGLGLQYGNLLGNIYNPDITIALPTAWGNLAGSFRMVNLSGSAVDMETGYGLSFGMGKDLTDRVMVGIAANVLFGSDVDGSSLMFLGGTIGSIYLLDGMKKTMGFGIFDPRLGFSLTAGFPIGDNSDYANLNNLTLGYNFRFYRHKNFNVGFYNDISLINFYKDFPVKAGVESLILDHYIVRAGGIFLNGYDFATLTAGVGYQFNKNTFAGSVNYSLAYDTESKFVHYLGLTLEYGELDRQSPVTSVKPDQRYISPNHDGVQDYVTFDLNVEDRSRIKGWKFQVMEPGGSVVREYRISERDVIKGLTFRGFFKHLFAKRTSMAVPKNIMWDGTDSKGEVLKDGKYSYSFTAWDEHDNIAATQSGIVIVDNTAPAVGLATLDSLFSPNNDRQKDEFIITQNVVSSPEDKWEAGFKDVEGNPVKRYRWNGDQVPSKVVWDGKDDKGNEVPEGLYYYYIATVDSAGNKAIANVKEITLTRQYEVADIRLEKNYFSYGIDREIRFYPSLSNMKGLQNYSVLILDDSKKPVHEIKGTRELPGVITWNGLDGEGEKFRDGEYFIKLSTGFESGNTPASFEKKLIIDSTPPKAEVKHSPDLFSPDGDDENDTLTISTDVKEQFGVKEWKIEIKNPSGILFKTFTGDGQVPSEIKWDGLGDDKDIVESAVDYDMTLYTVDNAGNKSKTDVDKISVDILVIVTERGLKMRISNIQFAFDSAKLQKQGMKILDRVDQILDKYERYDVIIEGHTDDVGKEDYNLSLSERRAKSVLDYLVKQGTARERLQFVGMGESVPLYPNKTEENRRRNRRVEFLLIKKE